MTPREKGYAWVANSGTKCVASTIPEAAIQVRIRVGFRREMEKPRNRPLRASPRFVVTGVFGAGFFLVR
jgi:hypothetical protein